MKYAQGLYRLGVAGQSVFIYRAARPSPYSDSRKSRTQLVIGSLS